MNKLPEPFVTLLRSWFYVFLLAITFWAVLIVVALAQPDLNPPTAWITRPDLDLDHFERIQMNYPVVIRIVSRMDINPVCTAATRAKQSNLTYYACTSAEFDRCVIYIRSDVAMDEADQTFATIFLHELAHCHGWPADHPRSLTLNFPSLIPDFTQ